MKTINCEICLTINWYGKCVISAITGAKKCNKRYTTLCSSSNFINSRRRKATTRVIIRVYVKN